jgi:hypothetical protein
MQLRLSLAAGLGRYLLNRDEAEPTVFAELA